jgi:hypothetical protein
VVARALAKDREQRFATARDFASALQSAMRRAEDATVVPPADPLRKIEVARTDSRGHPSVPGSASMAGGSTVTQELELVYWKDIKDSTDPEELQGFLVKFPAGIYADLARRRLRKLSAGNAPDQTILSGTAMPDMEQDLDATRLRTGTTPLVVPTNPALPSTVTRPNENAFVRTVVEQRPQPTPELQPEAAATQSVQVVHPLPPVQPVPLEPAQASSKPSPAAAKSSVRPAVAQRKKPPVALFAAVGGLAVAVIAAFVLMMGKGAADKPASTVSGPAPSSSSQLAVAAPAVLTGAALAATPVSPVADPAGSQASAPAVKPSAARRPPPAAKPKAAASVAAAEAPRASAVAVSQKREETRAVPAPVVAAGPSPVDACRDKMFLSREFCLAENCKVAVQRSHPLCVQWRADVRIREAGRNNNNNSN